MGHRGMLGHVVALVLAELGWRVRTTDERYNGTPDAPLMEAVRDSGCRLIVNCARATDESTGGVAMLQVNSLLPLHLAATAGEAGLLVHASSDAVFRPGSRRPSIEDSPDAADGYGLSKRLGEACTSFCPTVVLRCSLIGPELGSARSLLERALTFQGPMHGYVDHRWNGITTLEWARLAHKALEGAIRPGIHHPACEPAVSKFELLSVVSEVFGRPSEVRRVQSGRPYDRVLEPTHPVGPISDQLEALRAWYRPLSDRTCSGDEIEPGEGQAQHPISTPPGP